MEKRRFRVFAIVLAGVGMVTTACSGGGGGALPPAQQVTSVKLARTGQTTCYNAAGTEIACANTGQDGDKLAGVASPNPRFTTNADTTVTDSLTGLVWAPNGNIMPARDNNWDQDDTANDGGVTWQHALDYIAKLNTESYLGHTDWRLPNINELESLIHGEYTSTALCGGAGCSDAVAWLNTQGFANVQAFAYWSSTTNVVDKTIAWFINNVGCVYRYDKAADRYVWPVRSGQ